MKYTLFNHKKEKDEHSMNNSQDDKDCRETKDISLSTQHDNAERQQGTQNEDMGTSGFDFNIEFSQPNMTQDLMILIVQAIETWAKRYNMENLPKDIVFQQALTAMNGIYNTLKKNK